MEYSKLIENVYAELVQLDVDIITRGTSIRPEELAGRLAGMFVAVVEGTGGTLEDAIYTIKNLK